jgi:DNA polymerase I-like protein with 3'-5' exonuclease and polymerase domains
MTKILSWTLLDTVKMTSTSLLGGGASASPHFPTLQPFPYISYDTETTGLSPAHGDRAYSFQLSTPDGQDYYYDIRYTPQAVQWINDQMRTFKGQIACHNASFDYRQSAASGIHLPIDQLRCTCIQETLLWEHHNSYSLDYLSRKHCKTHKADDGLYAALADQFGGSERRSTQILNLQHVTPEMGRLYDLVVEYGKGDTRSTLELYEYQLREIAKKNIQPIVDFEHRLLPHVIRAEQNGIRVHVERAQLGVVQIDGEISRAQTALESAVGFAVNVNAPDSVKQIFAPEWKQGGWWTRNGEPLEATPSGAASMAAPVLRGLSDPVAQQVLDLRSLIKTRDTFLMGHVLGSEVNGRVYPSINQAKTDRDVGTGTGRFSYSGPAMQQIPSRNKAVASIVKDLFLPEEGHVWIDSDMGSFEVRTFAHHANDPTINALFAKDPEFDMHQYVGDLTGLPRSQPARGGPYAKALNLAMLYAQGDGSTADQMGLPWEWDSFTPKGTDEQVTYRKAGEEAMRLINIYHGNIPGVKELQKGTQRIMEQRGYVFTPHGRHLHVPNKRLAYKTIALLCQATAGDYNKDNWITVNETLDEMGDGGKMLLNTHDSYGVSIPEDAAERNMREIKNRIENEQRIPLRIPLVLEVNRPGNTWWESVRADRWM